VIPEGVATIRIKLISRPKWRGRILAEPATGRTREAASTEPRVVTAGEVIVVSCTVLITGSLSG
jgi:hypothetical protein